MLKITNNLNRSLLIDIPKESGSNNFILDTLGAMESIMVSEVGPQAKILKKKGVVSIEEVSSAELSKILRKKEKDLEIKRVRHLKAKAKLAPKKEIQEGPQKPKKAKK